MPERVVVGVQEAAFVVCGVGGQMPVGLSIISAEVPILRAILNSDTPAAICLSVVALFR
jgi:hypothetical protein